MQVSIQKWMITTASVKANQQLYLLGDEMRYEEYTEMGNSEVTG
jgi:hypothetical protein